MSPPTELTRRLDSLLSDGGIPGCSVAVVSSEQLLWSQGFGYADLRSKTRAEPSTVYHLFSATKLYTAVAVLQLVQSGAVDLDRDAAQYLGERGARLQGITVRHLLNHSSGLRDTLKAVLAIYFPGHQAPSVAEALDAYQLKRRGKPGQKVVYGNVNFALLGRIVERVSGLEFCDYVTERMLKPLDIDAAFAVTAEMQPRMATGYMRRWDPFRPLLRWFLSGQVTRRLYRGRRAGLLELNDYNLSSAPIGGLVGSVEAFAGFARWQLSGGGRVLSEELTRQMQTLTVRGKAGIESDFGVGLGWKLGRSGDVGYLNHEGGGAGFTTETRLYPDQDLGIVLAMNTMRMPGTMRLAHQLCEVIREHQESSG